MIRDLKCLPYEERLRDRGLFITRKTEGGDLISVNEYLKCRNQIDGGEMTLWWCAATEQGATVKNWNTGSCIQTRGRTLLLSE